MGCLTLNLKLQGYLKYEIIKFVKFLNGGEIMHTYKFNFLTMLNITLAVITFSYVSVQASQDLNEEQSKSSISKNTSLLQER